MKKIIITLAIVITTLSSFAREGKEVNARVLSAFNVEFAGAQDITWTSGHNFYKAAFLYNSQHVFAFYSTEGEMLGMTRYISSVDLPMNLQAGLKKSYNDFWISDLFELSNSEGTGYYITLENADSKIVLKATGGANWAVFQKISKA